MMRISVIPLPEKRDVFVILLDGKPWKNIHQFIFGRRPSFPSEISSLEEWKDLFNQNEYRCAKNYVLRRLSLQSYYSAQLIKLLADRLVQSLTIERLIQDCFLAGYLDDQNWLDSFVRTHIKRYSIRVISLKLQAKGVSRSTIEELIEKWHNPAKEEQAIKHLLETRYRKKNLNDYKEKQKVIASLMRKGYSFQMIRSLLDN